MSVKQMTSRQIIDDLETLALTWPDGIPPEQADRVNALKRELARRNVEAPNPGKPSARDLGTDQVSAVDLLSVGALEKELRALADRGLTDDAAQQRFADVRFELRRRSKEASYGADKDEVTVAATPAALLESATRRTLSPVPPRALELPDEVAAPRRVKPLEKTVTSVREHTVRFDSMFQAAPVVLEHRWVVGDVEHGTLSRLTVAELDAFILMAQAVRRQAG